MHEVLLSEELAELYDVLLAEEKAGRKTNEKEFKLLKKGMSQLSLNYEQGVKMPRRLPIFKYYSEKYGIDNLWKLDVGQKWRLMYTLTTEGIKLITLILDLVDHKTYDERGGYHTS